MFNFPNWFESVAVLASLCAIVWQVSRWESKIRDEVDETKDILFERIAKLENQVSVFIAEKKANEKIITYGVDRLSGKVLSIERFLAKNSKFAIRDTESGDSGMFQ